MRQKNTKRMLQYWLNLYWQAGNEPGKASQMNWPSRNDIQPSDCRSLLSNMFILQRSGPNVNYRLAGTHLCSIYGRELKREGFAEAFVGDDQQSAESWVYRLGIDDYIVLICSMGETAYGETVNIETLMLPLLHEGQPGERILGITTPCEEPAWLGTTPIIAQTIRSVRILRPWEDEQPKFQPLNLKKVENQLPSRRHAADPPDMFSHFNQQANGDLTSDLSTVRKVKHLRIIDGGLS